VTMHLPPHWLASVEGTATRAVCDRVFKQRTELMRIAVDPAEFTVHVSMDIWANLLRESGAGYDGRASIFGLPLVGDPHLEPDTVVMRYEVPA